MAEMALARNANKTSYAARKETLSWHIRRLEIIHTEGANKHAGQIYVTHHSALFGWLSISASCTIL